MSTPGVRHPAGGCTDSRRVTFASAPVVTDPDADAAGPPPDSDQAAARAFFTVARVPR